MWGRKRDRRHPIGSVLGSERGVGDECEAFLAGRLAVFLRSIGRSVPPVAWLNQVVHATGPELAVLSAGGLDRSEDYTWRRTAGYLARSLLERARETGRPIPELQRELLLPLELELVGDPDARELDPADLIRVTLARLYELPERSA